MTVHFIGAGPGAADLVTVRGRDLLGRCPLCLYAGSMIPPELLNYCAAGARLVDTGGAGACCVVADRVVPAVAVVVEL